MALSLLDELECYLFELTADPELSVSLMPDVRRVILESAEMLGGVLGMPKLVEAFLEALEGER